MGADRNARAGAPVGRGGLDPLARVYGICPASGTFHLNRLLR